MSIFRLTLITTDKLKVCNTLQTPAYVDRQYIFPGDHVMELVSKVYFIAPDTVNSPLWIISGLI